MALTEEQKRKLREKMENCSDNAESNRPDADTQMGETKDVSGSSVWRLISGILSILFLILISSYGYFLDTSILDLFYAFMLAGGIVSILSFNSSNADAYIVTDLLFGSAFIGSLLYFLYLLLYVGFNSVLSIIICIIVLCWDGICFLFSEIQRRQEKRKKSGAVGNRRCFNEMSKSSFVCSIVGLLFFLVAIFGIIFSGIGIFQCSKDRKKYSGRGLAVAGLIIGIIAFTLNGLFLFNVYYENWEYRNEFSERNFNINVLPYEMQWNELNITLDDVHLYNLYENHGYGLVVWVSYDISDLNSDDRFWFKNNLDNNISGDFCVRVYCDSKDNEMDFDNIEYVGSSIDGDKLIFLFMDGMKRYDYSDARLYICTDIKQRKEENQSSEYSRTYSYRYRVNGENDEKIEIESLDKMDFHKMTIAIPLLKQFSGGTVS